MVTKRTRFMPKMVRSRFLAPQGVYRSGVSGLNGQALSPDIPSLGTLRTPHLTSNSLLLLSMYTRLFNPPGVPYNKDPYIIHLLYPNSLG